MFGKPRGVALLIPAALACLLVSPLSAVAQAFDFEDVPATFVSPPNTTRPGGYSSLVMTKGGVTATITRSQLEGNGIHPTVSFPFDIVQNDGNQGGKPTGWGNHS